jgi:HPt (histidine-containing phosphotransfer) domain-containing protein
LYQKFLVKFSNTYADAAQTMRWAIESNDRPAAVALAHKLKGAASNMPLPEVTKIAGEIERFLKLSTDETAADNFTLGAQPLLAQLDQALAIALNSIARYAPSSNEMEGTAIITALEPTQQAIVTRLLQSLLEALDTDDPARAEPVLEQLATEITMTQLQAVRAALDDFDFRSAEAATRQLAASLHLLLDN